MLLYPFGIFRKQPTDSGKQPQCNYVMRFEPSCVSFSHGVAGFAPLMTVFGTSIFMVRRVFSVSATNNCSADLAADMLRFLLQKPHKNTRIFLWVDELAANSSGVVFSHPQLHPCSFQTIYFLCTQFNPVYCSPPPQEGCVFTHNISIPDVHLGQVVEGFTAILSLVKESKRLQHAACIPSCHSPSSIRFFSFIPDKQIHK